MLQGNASGFLVGTPASELMRRLAEGQQAGLGIARRIKADTARILSALGQNNRVAARALATPAVRTGGAAPRSMPARDAGGRFVAPYQPATRSGGGGAARAPRPAVPSAAPSRGDYLRNARGQFTSGGGSGEAGSAGGGSGKAGRGSSASSRARLRALAQLGGQAAELDATTGAAREIGAFVGPLVGLLRGDPGKKKEKKDEARQKRSEKWFKKIWEALSGQGLGLLGMLGGLLSSVFGGQGILGRLLGGAGAGALAGAGGKGARGGRAGWLGRLGKRFPWLGKAGRFLARSRIPILGTAMAALLYGAEGMAAENDPTLSPEQRRAARYQSVGRGVGGVGGGLAGGMLGFSIGGPIGAVVGAWLGASGGEMIGQKFGEWTKSLVDADLPGKIAMRVGDFMDWLKGPAKKAITEAYEAAVNAASNAIDASARTYDRTVNAASDMATSVAEGLRNARAGLLERIARIESGGSYSASGQRARFLVGRGGSTASGKYQFLDGTFASIVAKHGAADPALSGLVPLASAYLADRRGVRVKAMDSKYSQLFAAKLNPASAEAAMRFFTADNVSALAAAGITDSTDAEVYSVHLSGRTALARALRNAPDTPIANVLSADQIRANAPLLSGISTVGQLGARLNRKMGTATPALPTYAMSSTMPAPPLVPRVPDVSLPALLGGGGGREVVVVQAPHIGQNVPDRGIAHVAAGGVGLNNR